MGERDPRVDAYIEASAEFARPILRYLREIVHEGCPGAEEDIKWNFPVFVYEGMLANMAAHKQHCSFGFWKASLILDDAKAREGMGHFGKITSMEDLPEKEILLGYVRKAAELNEKGVKPRKKATAKSEVEMPEDFASALEDVEGALDRFQGMSPSHRREYVEWITEAKRNDTRRRRIRKAVDQIASGKSLNWKYA